MVNLARQPFVRAGIACALVGTALCGSRSGREFFASGFSRTRPWDSSEDEPPKHVPGDGAVDVITENIRAKDAIARAVMAGQMPLADAVAQFRALDARRPPNLAISLPEKWGRTVEERYAVCVVTWATILRVNQPDAEAARARLQAVLRDYLSDTSSDRGKTTGL